MKTIRQIADEVGVSKQAIRNQIAKLGLQTTLRKNGNQFAIDEHHETLIKRAFIRAKNTKETQTVTDNKRKQVDDLIAMLRNELEAKNEQLAAKDRQLEAANAALRAEQLLHADTKGIPFISTAEQTTTNAPQPSRWARLVRAWKGNN